MKTLYLQAAYGRYYHTVDQALQDWISGKDFLITGGPYCSIRDMQLFLKEGYTRAEFFTEERTYILFF